MTKKQCHEKEEQINDELVSVAQYDVMCTVPHPDSGPEEPGRCVRAAAGWKRYKDGGFDRVQHEDLSWQHTMS